MRGMKLLLVPVMLLVAGAALAQTTGGPAVDVAAVTATISNQLPSITSVGEGVLAVLVAIMAFKWVRRAF